MNEPGLEHGLVELLRRIAPDIDPATFDRHASLREDLDLDSMDVLNLLAAIHERYGVEIPDAEAGRIRTFEDLRSTVEARLAG